MGEYERPLYSHFQSTDWVNIFKIRRICIEQIRTVLNVGTGYSVIPLRRLLKTLFTNFPVYNPFDVKSGDI